MRDADDYYLGCANIYYTYNWTYRFCTTGPMSMRQLLQVLFELFERKFNLQELQIKD